MSAIIWPKADGDWPPVDFDAKLREKLRGRVNQAYTFGSYETEAFRSGSDIDLILVKESKLPFVERAREFTDLYKLYPRLDILVYSKQELERQLEETVGFWASVKTTLRELPLE